MSASAIELHLIRFRLGCRSARQSLEVLVRTPQSNAPRWWIFGVPAQLASLSAGMEFDTPEMADALVRPAEERLLQLYDRLRPRVLSNRSATDSFQEGLQIEYCRFRSSFLHPRD